MSIEINNTTSALIQRKKVKVDNLNNILAKIVKENPQASEEQILKLFTETLMKNRPLFGKLSNNDIRKIIANTNINLQTTYVYKDEVFLDNQKIYDVNDKRNLIGEHNLRNIMVVLTVAKILELNMKKAVKSCNEFEPLEHRIEYVGKFNDIIYSLYFLI